MKTEIKGSDLIITIPLNPVPTTSSTGKTMIAAGTGGFKKTGIQVHGKELSVMVNATIPAR